MSCRRYPCPVGGGGCCTIVTSAFLRQYRTDAIEELDAMKRFCGISIEECDALHAGDLEGLTAVRVLAGDLIVFAYHITARLGIHGATALVGIRRQRAFLSAHQPGDLVISGLAAVGAGQLVRLALFFF